MITLLKRLFGVYIGDELQHTERAITNYIAAWKELIESSGHPDQDWQLELFNHMYNNLDALDTKTTSLLQFNAIMAAAYTLFANAYGDGFTSWLRAVNGLDDLFSQQYLFVVISVAFLAISIFASLQVVWVHWSRTEELSDPDRHLRVLIKVRNQRTMRYRRAWLYSVTSLLAMVAAIASINFGLPAFVESNWVELVVLLGTLWIVRVHVSEAVIHRVAEVFGR